MNKNEIVSKITELTEMQSKIQKELDSLCSDYNDIVKEESKQYIGKCYKQEFDNGGTDTFISYYKIIDHYEDDSNCFWAIKVNNYFDENLNCKADIHYVTKTCINLLGFKKYMLRCLTPITITEFNDVFDNVYESLR